MITKFRMMLAAMVFATAIGGTVLTVATPQAASAAGCDEKVLLFPTWYRGLGEGADCKIKSPSEHSGGISGFIWTIALNVIEMALVAVGYISVGYIIWGGFQYMLVAASPDRVVQARKTILNACIGLVISFFSVVIVNIVVGGFK